MRKLIFAIAVAFLTSTFMTAGTALAEDSMSRLVSQGTVKVALLKQDQTAEQETLLQKLRRINPDQLAFCGQCTTNSDCGTGYKCAGRPECMECTKSP